MCRQFDGLFSLDSGYSGLLVDSGRISCYGCLRGYMVLGNNGDCNGKDNGR